jgi:hypothetical protein
MLSRGKWTPVELLLFNLNADTPFDRLRVNGGLCYHPLDKLGTKLPFVLSLSKHV